LNGCPEGQFGRPGKEIACVNDIIPKEGEEVVRMEFGNLIVSYIKTPNQTTGAGFVAGATREIIDTTIDVNDDSPKRNADKVGRKVLGVANYVI
jgi:hypothetical protein